MTKKQGRWRNRIMKYPGIEYQVAKQRNNKTKREANHLKIKTKIKTKKYGIRKTEHPKNRNMKTHTYTYIHENTRKLNHDNPNARLHYVDFASSRPVPSSGIGGQHPKRSPQPKSSGHPNPGLYSAREKADWRFRSDSRRCVPFFVHRLKFTISLIATFEGKVVWFLIILVYVFIFRLFVVGLRR